MKQTNVLVMKDQKKVMYEDVECFVEFESSNHQEVVDYFNSVCIEEFKITVDNALECDEDDYQENDKYYLLRFKTEGPVGSSQPAFIVYESTVEILDEGPQYDSAGFTIDDREDDPESGHHCDDLDCNCSPV